MTGAEWAVLASATLVGVCVQSTVGFGYAFFVAPALFLTGSAAQAVVLLLALGVLVNLLMLYGEPRVRGGLRPIVVPMVLWALPGMALGYLCLVLVPKEALQMLVGVVIVAASLTRARASEPAAAGSIAGSAAFAGLSSGALTSSTGLNGPPLVPWASRHSKDPAGMRHLIAAGLLALNGMGVLVVALGGGTGNLGRAPLLFLALAPVVVVGHQLGKLLLARLDPDGHRIVVLVAAAATGTASFLAGGTALI